MLQIGKCYYFITHAYYHYVGEVVAIHGVRRVSLTRVRQVHSCGRNWTEFFADGFKKDTRFDVIPDAPDFTYFQAFAWDNKIPEAK